MKLRELLEVSAAVMGERSKGEDGYDLELFEANAPRLINVLCQECFELDCTVKGLEPDSFVHGAREVTGLEDEIPMHEAIVKSVLPYGLCYLFLINEDLQRAEIFKKKYLENKERLSSTRSRARRHGIVDVYR